MIISHQPTKVSYTFLVKVQHNPLIHPFPLTAYDHFSNLHLQLQTTPEWTWPPIATSHLLPVQDKINSPAIPFPRGKFILLSIHEIAHPNNIISFDRNEVFLSKYQKLPPWSRQSRTQNGSSYIPFQNKPDEQADKRQTIKNFSITAPTPKSNCTQCVTLTHITKDNRLHHNWPRPIEANSTHTSILIAAHTTQAFTSHANNLRCITTPSSQPMQKHLQSP